MQSHVVFGLLVVLSHYLSHCDSAKVWATSGVFAGTSEVDDYCSGGSCATCTNFQTLPACMTKDAYGSDSTVCSPPQPTSGNSCGGAVMDLQVTTVNNASVTLGQWFVERSSSGRLAVTLRMRCGWLLVGGAAMTDSNGNSAAAAVSIRASWASQGEQQGVDLQAAPEGQGQGLFSCLTLSADLSSVSSVSACDTSLSISLEALVHLQAFEEGCMSGGELQQVAQTIALPAVGSAESDAAVETFMLGAAREVVGSDTPFIPDIFTYKTSTSIQVLSPDGQAPLFIRSLGSPSDVSGSGSSTNDLAMEVSGYNLTAAALLVAGPSSWVQGCASADIALLAARTQQLLRAGAAGRAPTSSNSSGNAAVNASIECSVVSELSVGPRDVASAVHLFTGGADAAAQTQPTATAAALLAAVHGSCGGGAAQGQQVLLRAQQQVQAAQAQVAGAAGLRLLQLSFSVVAPAGWDMGQLMELLQALPAAAPMQALPMCMGPASNMSMTTQAQLQVTVVSVPDGTWTVIGDQLSLQPQLPAPQGQIELRIGPSNSSAPAGPDTSSAAIGSSSSSGGGSGDSGLRGGLIAAVVIAVVSAVLGAAAMWMYTRKSVSAAAWAQLSQPLSITAQGAKQAEGEGPSKAPNQSTFASLSIGLVAAAAPPPPPLCRSPSAGTSLHDQTPMSRGRPPCRLCGCNRCHGGSSKSNSRSSSRSRIAPDDAAPADPGGNVVLVLKEDPSV